ncbi:hypothetical protein JTB14_007234 [Gonioctena quinquepunctata]|nr:hypothetical protein JTB14_007234 [Gonioctena quinquepunctata]
MLLISFTESYSLLGLQYLLGVTCLSRKPISLKYTASKQSSKNYFQAEITGTILEATLRQSGNVMTPRNARAAAAEITNRIVHVSQAQSDNFRRRFLSRKRNNTTIATKQSLGEVHCCGEFAGSGNSGTGSDSAKESNVSLSSAESTSEGNKRKKISFVWNAFKKYNDKKFAKCVYCSKEYKTSGNTSHLKDHLKIFDPKDITFGSAGSNLGEPSCSRTAYVPEEFPAPVVHSKEVKSEADPGEESQKSEGLLTKIRRSVSISAISVANLTNYFDNPQDRKKSTFYCTDTIDIDGNEDVKKNDETIVEHNEDTVSSNRSSLTSQAKSKVVRPKMPPPPVPVEYSGTKKL